MYCRLQCYPAPRLISYKIPGIRVLWGFGVTLPEVSTIGCARSFLRVILCPSDSHPTESAPHQQLKRIQKWHLSFLPFFPPNFPKKM